MKLPSEYPEIVAAGVATLRVIAADVRTAAIRRSDAPELWLTVRDLEGLADRLAGLDEWHWRHGFADTFVTGQDLAVLDELLEVGVGLPTSTVVSVTPEQAARLTRLREVRQQSGEPGGDTDEPAA
jgi:hypothetical protein